MVTDKRRRAIDELLRAWDAGREQEAEIVLLEIVRMLWGTENPFTRYKGGCFYRSLTRPSWRGGIGFFPVDCHRRSSLPPILVSQEEHS